MAMAGEMAISFQSVFPNSADCARWKDAQTRVFDPAAKKPLEDAGDNNGGIEKTNTLFVAGK